jgi:hypothetical protein
MVCISAALLIHAFRWWAGAPWRLLRWVGSGQLFRREQRQDWNVAVAYSCWMRKMRSSVPYEVQRIRDASG